MKFVFQGLVIAEKVGAMLYLWESRVQSPLLHDSLITWPNTAGCDAKTKNSLFPLAISVLNNIQVQQPFQFMLYEIFNVYIFRSRVLFDFVGILNIRSGLD